MSSWPYRPVTPGDPSQRKHRFAMRTDYKGRWFNTRFRPVVVNLPDKEA